MLKFNKLLFKAKMIKFRLICNNLNYFPWCFMVLPLDVNYKRWSNVVHM